MMLAQRTTPTAVLLLLGGVAFGAGPSVPKTEEGVNNTAVEKVKMFPDGRTYNFGKAKRGTIVKHAFRIVNTSNVPLEILSLRWS